MWGERTPAWNNFHLEFQEFTDCSDMPCRDHIDKCLYSRNVKVNKQEHFNPYATVRVYSLWYKGMGN